MSSWQDLLTHIFRPGVWARGLLCRLTRDQALQLFPVVRHYRCQPEGLGKPPNSAPYLGRRHAVFTAKGNLSGCCIRRLSEPYSSSLSYCNCIHIQLPTTMMCRPDHACSLVSIPMILTNNFRKAVRHSRVSVLIYVANTTGSNLTNT